jgi:hypothetical protein
MHWEEIDWNALERLRNAFLEGTAGERDYWLKESDLASYDATFAQRIGWKWDYVLGELKLRNWSPVGGEVLDWGCGTGIAGRAFLDHFSEAAPSGLHVWDRSPMAMNFALRRAREKYPHLPVSAGLAEDPATILISHVLTELNDEEVHRLAERSVLHATSVLWVEPGTHETSRRLIEVRERLRDRINVIAPCTHPGACGMLTSENQRHWCHHFAAPPPEVSTDPDWGKFARLAGIDLRALPLSFLVLDKRPAPPMPASAARLIGRPRIYKPHAVVLACDATGICERQVSKRHCSELYRRLKKDEMVPLQKIESQGEEIISMTRLI